VFEAHDRARRGRPVIGGGRYDKLLAKRSAPADDIPAVGAAIWVDRLTQFGGAA
jgi:ATP phosphoribosyltransferase regulatory subunit